MKKSLIGLDIGGSKIDAIFWRDGRILRAETIKTPRSRRAFLESLVRLIKGLMGGEGVKGIGVAVAGGIDYKSGTILNSPNLKFLNGVRLGRILQKKLKVPVKMDNDTNCFLLGEVKLGQAKRKKHVVALTLGTGVGGAVLVDGKLLRGRHGAAGELGHMIIEKNLSVEDLVSSHGIKRFGFEDSLVLQKKAFAGDKKATVIYMKIGEYLGMALANLINTFDPEIIILGGGISKAGPLLLPAARRELKKLKKHILLPEKYFPPIKVSRLKHAGALGAVALFGK